MTLPLPVPYVGSPETQQNFDALAAQFPLGPHQTHHQIYPQARVYNNAAISIADNTPTALTFNSERWDYYPAGYTEQHSTSSNTGRLTCRVAGSYLIGGSIEFAANATGFRAVGIRLNGSTSIAESGHNAPIATFPLRVSLSSAYRLAVGDYVDMAVYQNSGGSLNVNASGNFSPEFWFVWTSP